VKLRRQKSASKTLRQWQRGVAELDTTGRNGTKGAWGGREGSGGAATADRGTEGRRRVKRVQLVKLRGMVAGSRSAALVELD
jgi:hypothetical protein